MADLLSYGHHERDRDRDIEQAVIALKKGTQLVKYSRKGKPKFRPFRLSTDATTLIWYSHGEERNLKLSSVSKIVPGQRTAVFRRYLRPEKDYLSFSLIYKNGERSLDLICKDKEEVEVWLAGLKALIPTGQRGGRTRTDVPDWNDADSIQDNHTLEFSTSITFGRLSVDSYSSSDAGFAANMQLRASGGDGFRLSVSSTPSCSSQGSGVDDIESLGDVYVWGELWSDGVSVDGSVGPFSSKIDVLTPKPLESNVVLDVHQIACGVRHIALVTRQGEVFTWGEESGGRLGHGIERDFGRPHLVEFLAVTNVDFVSCGEYHTSAVSTSGDLFTWGDGTHNAGLLGHGTDVSHWIPKRVSGPIEGLQVLSIACGTWHTALTTTSGKLFTFGDGTFGVLGHGDRESVPYPREVQQLSGLKTVKVACGVWHTAAIVEVIMNPATGTSISSRKLFTWGDGDKYRLGHGNKDTYLLPTCVSKLIDYNFHQIACGYTMTVALTTSGHVFTMGGTANGQLGNPQADGKVPCLVQERLVGEFVEEISCGAFHVAVLTSRSEVFTWGKGANGRLGHGDAEDRKSPTLVEALKDRHVKSISCGSRFTATVCIHKWVSGADQSICSGCRQAFGFTKKRHNCYNCGLVHCHACSSKKALRAALAPTPGKPHRVCDACYNKLKATGANSALNLNKKVAAPRHSLDSSSRFDREEVRSSRILLSPTTEPIKYLELKTQKPGAKSDTVSIVRASQVPSFQQLKDIAFPSSLSALQSALKPVVVAPPPPQLAPAPASVSRPASPHPRRPSSPRSAPPVLSRGIVDSLKKSNELLSQEVARLQNQVKALKKKCKAQDEDIQKLNKNAKDAILVVAKQSSKLKIAREVVKSITTQLKEVLEKMPPDVCDSESFKAMQNQAETFLETSEAEASEPQPSMPLDFESDQQNLENGGASVVIEATSMQDQKTADTAGVRDLSQNGTSVVQASNQTPASDSRDSAALQAAESDTRSHQCTKNHDRASEVIEQFEPGVYVTVIQLRDGTKIFKRVRFSKRRFSENQAEEWWKENKDRMMKKYAPPPPPHAAPSAPPSIPPPQPASSPPAPPTPPLSGDEGSGTIASSPA
ncbi:hypothetical protein Ancab_013094 [Ancistrocladus abbreviatus]